MIKCGDVVNQVINQTVQEIVAAAYFGNGFRFAVMFYHVKSITITNLTMINTLGYGLSAFNAIGDVTLSNVHIKDTTFENDPECWNYNYRKNDADFSCSGSGMLFFYHDNVEIGNVTEANTPLRIEQSVFENNRNFLPVRQFNILADVIKTGYYRVPIPLQGAGCVATYLLFAEPI